MRKPICPRCGSFNLQEITDGFYRCLDCGYKGTLGIEKEIIKKV